MPHLSPQPGCDHITLEAPYAAGDGAEVALEDYARTLTRARAAEALRDAGSPEIRGVHVCGLPAELTSGQRRDITDFARSLAVGSAGGLGWS